MFKNNLFENQVTGFKMKKNIIYFSIVFLLLFISTELFAANVRKRYFNRPQIGAWFGPITPMFKTGDKLETNLGGGGFFRYNLPLDSLKVGFESSYQKFKSQGVDELQLIPAYMNLVYLLPFNFPVRAQVKGGAGFCHVEMKPDKISQWDPMFSTGVEISFPAGKMANIALRIDYMLIFERHIEGAKNNGHVINAGVSLYLNLNL